MTLRWLVAVVLSVVGGLMPTSPGHPAATATTYAYDGHSVEHPGVRAIDLVGIASSHLNEVGRRSAAPAGAIQDRSTTQLGAVVATNSADDVLRLGTKDSWGKLNTLDDHFARHGADFGATSADDYARQASEFLQRPGNLTKIDPKTGVIRVYDPATGAFGAYNPTGTTRTFYVPDPAKHGYPTNLDYWNAQPG